MKKNKCFKIYSLLFGLLLSFFITFTIDHRASAVQSYDTNIVFTSQQKQQLSNLLICNNNYRCIRESSDLGDVHYFVYSISGTSEPRAVAYICNYFDYNDSSVLVRKTVPNCGIELKYDQNTGSHEVDLNAAFYVGPIPLENGTLGYSDYAYARYAKDSNLLPRLITNTDNYFTVHQADGLLVNEWGFNISDDNDSIFDSLPAFFRSILNFLELLSDKIVDLKNELSGVISDAITPILNGLHDIIFNGFTVALPRFFESVISWFDDFNTMFEDIVIFLFLPDPDVLATQFESFIASFDRHFPIIKQFKQAASDTGDLISSLIQPSCSVQIDAFGFPSAGYHTVSKTISVCNIPPFLKTFALYLTTLVAFWFMLNRLDRFAKLILSNHEVDS